ncbi:MAG TPA: MMPL family transporter [Candidatus Acidoferrales bacterium]|nr:MMPL family transporter [Candidatus Acidoferrales bacterium]
MKVLSPDSLLARLLGRLTAAICRHPRAFFWPQVVLFIASIAVTALYLKFDMSQDNLVSSKQKYHRNYLNYKKEFSSRDEDDLAVVTESEDPEKNRQFIERLGAKLETETNLFRDVFYRADFKMMGSKALLLLSEDDLGDMKTRLNEYQPFIQRFTTATNLVSFFDQINTQFRTMPRETNAQTTAMVQALPVLEKILVQATDALKRSGVPPSPGATTLFNAGGDVLEGRMTFDHGRIRLLIAQALSDEVAGDAVERLRELVAQTQSEVPGLNVGVTGGPVLDYDQMNQSQHDTMVASIVSLIICALIFIYGYNETGRPVKATVCLIVGLAYTLAFATLTVGHLNILTVTFVPILIGLAIDFGVHLVTRYEEELRHGKTAEQALMKAMMFTGQGIFTGALTTAGAFLAMALTDFKGISEMGIICGGGLMVCLIPMMTLLPVLLLRGRQNVMDNEIGEDDRRARIENVWLQRPVLVAAIIAVLCGLAAFQAKKIYFDYNLLDLQSKGLPAVEYEQKLFTVSERSPLYCAVVANSLDEAVALEKRIQALPSVASNGVDSIAGALKENQTEKLRLIGDIKAEIAPLQFSPPDLRPADLYALSQTLYSFNGYVGNALADKDVQADAELAKEFTALGAATMNLRKTMLEGDAAALAEHADKLGSFQRAFFTDISDTFEQLQQQDSREPLKAGNLPAALRNRFVGATGKFLLQVYPKDDVRERDKQEEFVKEMRTVDPNVTGEPVQLYEYTTLLKDSYITAAWYSLAAIAFMVLVHFRSLLAVILALIPVGIGTLWLAGLMGWLGVPFNPANIMTLPLVIGIGVTNGIHILNRYAEERTPNILARSTGKAVLVSGLTAIAGFGSLILAKHRGIHSLGVIMSVGIATCMIAGLTFLPALLNLLGRTNVLNKKPDVEDKPATPGQEEPR